MQELGLLIHQPLDLAEFTAAAAFHHISCQRPGTSGEADQRHPPIQFAANQSNCIRDIAKRLFRIRHRQPVDLFCRADRMAKLGALAFDELQAQPHGIRDGENVGKQNRRIQAVTLQRLQRDLASQFR